MNILAQAITADHQSVEAVANVVAQTVQRTYEISPRHVLVLGYKSGGDLAGERTDMSTLEGYGSGYTRGDGEWEVCAEEGPYDWTVEASFALNDRFHELGIPVFCEPATGYALSFYQD
jgi:hypothetical protein